MATIETDTLRRSSATSRGPSQIDVTAENPRWPLVVAVLCVAFLAYTAGAFMIHFHLGPGDSLRRAFQGGAALYDQLLHYNEPVKTEFWQNARSDERGVTRYDPTRAQNGLTLYTSSHEQKAFLMDMRGRVVHEWSMPFSRVWDSASPIVRPRPDGFIYMEKVHVFPNGDLLALYTAIGDTPWGYGLAKMDRDSNLIWKYFGHAHHDFDFDSEGNIFVLTHEISETDVAAFANLTKPRIDDFVVKLSPDGKELKKLRLIDMLAASPFSRRLLFSAWQIQYGNGDYLHANSVKVLKRAVPGIPQSRRGQALVSLREISTLVLVDPDSAQIVWAASGPWLRQHDAEILPNGHLLLFDNEGNPSGPGVSRVIEIDPATQEVVWSYGTRDNEPLDSVARSTQSRLPNGNTLIVESMAGRLLEVTPGGDIVWEFVNPVRGGPRQDRIPVIFWVQRLDPGLELAPRFRRTLDYP